MRLGRVSFGVLTGMMLLVSTAVAQESDRLPIVARGQQRQEIKSTPILERPYRPLHFYGNTVRRQYAHATGAMTAQGAVRNNGSRASQR